MYRHPGLTDSACSSLLRSVERMVSKEIQSIDTEFCFNMKIEGELTGEEKESLSWLLRETFIPDGLKESTCLVAKDDKEVIVEVGPRMNFSTAWSTNAVYITHTYIYIYIIGIYSTFLRSYQNKSY